jgi:hypothetical protein
MKNILVCLIICLSISAQAQNFEGTVNWSIKTEITDPAMKQKMESAQSQLNDPKTKAQMKEMEEKMKDPQFQQMMQQNPQLKAQMDMILNAQKSGGGLESMMPKSLIIKAKNGSTLTKMDGGMFGSEVLYLKEKDQRYSIKRDAKTFSVLPKEQAGTTKEEKPKVKITKTTETAKILNYTCTKYIIESTDGKSLKGPQVIWTTTEIKDIDPKSFANSSVGKGQDIMYDGVPGMPMRIEMKTKEMNMVMEVAEINREKLNSADFSIPAGFSEVKSSY